MTDPKLLTLARLVVEEAAAFGFDGNNVNCVAQARAILAEAEPYGPDNPRFVWVIGAIREQFPDIPPSCEGGGGVTLWDRKHRTEVIILDDRYAQAMVLETTREPGDAPFTRLADWLNRLSHETLASENLPV